MSKTKQKQKKRERSTKAPATTYATATDARSWAQKRCMRQVEPSMLAAVPSEQEAMSQWNSLRTGSTAMRPTSMHNGGPI
eukprot:1369338-Rhodomonas_salina.1